MNVLKQTIKDMSSKILIIYTGGTIGMKEDPQDQTLKPFDFSQIKEEVPELNISIPIPILMVWHSTGSPSRV